MFLISVESQVQRNISFLCEEQQPEHHGKWKPTVDLSARGSVRHGGRALGLPGAQVLGSQGQLLFGCQWLLMSLNISLIARSSS